LGKAREKARQVSCISQLKQIGTTLMLYIADNHDLCTLLTTDPPNYNEYAWNGILANYTGGGVTKKDYVNGMKIFRCPNHRQIAGPDGNQTMDKTVYWSTGSYGLNSVMQNNNSTSAAARGYTYLLTSRLASPSNTLHSGEYCNYPVSGVTQTTEWRYAVIRANGDKLNTIQWGAGFYHGGDFTNVLYFDGHVGTVNGKELMLTKAADSPWNSLDIKKCFMKK